MDSEFRHQVLVKRVMTVNELRREMCGRWNNSSPTVQSSKMIPVPLYHGETMDQYSQKFEQWLEERHESMDSLRDYPTREREFWFAFAYLRVGTIDTVGSSRKRAFQNENYYPRYDKAEVETKRGRYCKNIEAEAERLQESESLSNGNTESTSAAGSCDVVRNSHPTERAPHVARDGRESNNANSRFQRARDELLAQRVLTPDEYLREVKERSQNRSVPPLQQQKLTEIPVPLYPGETVHEYEKEFRRWVLEHLKPEKERELRCQFALWKATARRSSGDHEDEADVNIEFEKLSQLWSVFLIDQIQDLERQVTKLQQEVDCYRSTAGTRNILPRVAAQSDDCKSSKKEAFRPDTQPALLGSSDFLQSKSAFNDEMLTLAEAYNHLNNKVATNEIAVADALSYVKSIADVDDVQNKECQLQILELAASISQEKEKRASALAATIVSNWSEQQEMLMSLVEEEPASVIRSTGAMHRELGTISSHIVSKDYELKALKTQIDEQVQLVKRLPPPRTAAGRALRERKLRKLSGNLTQEQATRDHLEKERQILLKSFVQGDTEVRKLVQKLFNPLTLLTCER